MYLAFFSITISKRDELFSTNNCQIKSFNSQDSCPCCSASWTQPALGLADLRVTNIHLLFLILRRKWLHMMFFSHNHYESSLSPSQVGTSSDNIFYFSYFFIISEHSCRYYYRMSNRIEKTNKKSSNWLLFSVHGVLMALKFCTVGKCTIADTTFVRGFLSLLVNLFLWFPFLCHALIGIYYLI